MLLLLLTRPEPKWMLICGDFSMQLSRCASVVKAKATMSKIICNRLTAPGLYLKISFYLLLSFSRCVGQKQMGDQPEIVQDLGIFIAML